MKFWIGAAAVFVATSAQASVDCDGLNSRSALESVEWGDLINCLEYNPAIIGEQDDADLNLVANALTAEMDPITVYDMLKYVEEDDWDTVISATDIKNRTLGHIAAEEAIDPGMIFVLSAYDISTMDEQNSAGGWLDFGSSPLHLAAARKDGWPIIAALLATGNSQLPDQNDMTPLDVALAGSDTTNNALLLADGAWPEIYRDAFEAEAAAEGTDCSSYLTTAFFKAATEAQVVACVRQGAKLDSVDGSGNSALHLAAQAARDPWIIDFLLSEADDPAAMLGARNADGMTPLHLAAALSPEPDVVAHLLAWGADPDARMNAENKWAGKDRGTTALHLAAKRDDDHREEVLLNLLAFGGNTMIQTASGDKPGGGRTALHLAALRPDPRVELMLLEAQFHQESLIGGVIGALRGRLVKQIPDDEGRTVLHMVASRNSDVDSLLMLLEYGFSVDSGDKAGNTPLMFAANFFEDPDLFMMMLDQSEEPCKSSKTGVTVESAVRQNPKLNAEQTDMSGKTLSVLSNVKKRCP